jgi:very-short-patch-repair endonuclease
LAIDFHLKRNDFLEIIKNMKIPDIIRLTARKLRNNMTESEVILWNFIKDKKL